jgi:hypothetical protein
MGAFKTGRLPGVRPTALKDFEVYATGPIPTPPPTREVPKSVYPMDCNDRLGDCTIAGVVHLLEAWNVESSEHDAIPGESVIESEYFKLTGGEDTGLVENAVLSTWHTQGLFGNKIAGYAPVNPKDLLQLHQAIAFYGGCYLGILCPESAQRQFQEGKPWTYEGEETQDGHCVAALGYGPNGGLHVATWGGVAVLEASFLAHYLQEAYVVLPQELVERKGDSLGLDLAALQADLRLV